MEPIKLHLKNGTLYPINDININNLLNKKINVIIINDNLMETNQRREKLKVSLKKLQKLNPFVKVEKPELWQSKIREERELPGRQ